MQYLQKHFKKLVIPFLVLGGLLFTQNALAVITATYSNTTTAATATNWISDGSYGTSNPNGRGWYWTASVTGELDHGTMDIALYNYSGGSGQNSWRMHLLDGSGTPLDCQTTDINIADAYSGSVTFSTFTGPQCSITASTNYTMLLEYASAIFISVV